MPARDRQREAFESDGHDLELCQCQVSFWISNVILNQLLFLDNYMSNSLEENVHV